MNKDLNERIAAYRVGVSIITEMLKSGVISQADFELADEALKAKFSLKNMTIFG